MIRRDSIKHTPLSGYSLASGASYAAPAFAGSRAIPHSPQRARRRSNARIHFWAVVLALLACLYAAAGSAQDNYREQMKGLDEQVQEIKSDVLSIAQELNRLEERLLYPSNTQIALFVALEGGEALRLDAVRIQIDGQPVARYIYSHKELEALKKGGVQRIYTGNVPTGAHKLEVSVVGKLSGKDYSESGTFTISKGIEPKLVGITLAGPETGKAAIAIGDW
jgi:hypothetical protein